MGWALWVRVGDASLGWRDVTVPLGTRRVPVFPFPGVAEVPTPSRLQQPEGGNAQRFLPHMLSWCPPETPHAQGSLGRGSIQPHACLPPLQAPVPITQMEISVKRVSPSPLGLGARVGGQEGLCNVGPGVTVSPL